jgi:hypothetical protein
VKVTVEAASLLAATPQRPTPGRTQVQWNPELARVGTSREVTVEAVVNGRPVAQQRMTADGTLRNLSFDVPIQRSSWIAVRILGSRTPIRSSSWLGNGRSVRHGKVPSGA